MDDDKYYVLKNGGTQTYLGYGKDSLTVLSNLDYSCVVQLIKSGNSYKIKHVSTDSYFQGFSQANAPLTLDKKEEVEYTITRVNNSNNFYFTNNSFLLHYDNTNPVLGAAPNYNGGNSQWTIWEVDLEKGTEVKYSPLAYPQRITNVNDLSESDYYILKNYGNKRYICNTSGENTLGLKDSPDHSCVVQIKSGGTDSDGNNIYKIKHVSTGSFFQGLTNSQALTLGKEEGGDYTFNTEIKKINNTKNVICFRLANNSLYINGNGGTPNPVVGFNGTGDYSLWEIYKVSNTLPFNEDDITAETIKFNNGGTYNVSLNRNINATFNTVVLPFNLDAEQVENLFGAGSVVYEFSDRYDAESKEAVIKFNTRKGGDIEANTPVLVKATSDSNSNTIKDVTIESGDDELTENGTCFDFTGVYSSTTVPANSYFLSGDTLYKSVGSTNIKPFRAYLQSKENNGDSENGNKVSTVRLNIGDIVTGIDHIDAAKAESDIIYNLFGQRVTKMEKGIYIVNGKKIIVE